MKSTIYICFSVLLIFQSCRKDKLEGDKQLLIGKWRWSFTKVFYDNIGSPNDPPSDTIYAGDCFDTYELDFLEKGIVKSLKNGKVNKRKRIVFDEHSDFTESNPLAIIELNNRDTKRFGIGLREDDLDLLNTLDEEFTGLPFEDNLAGSFPGDNVDTCYTHFYRRVD